MLARLVASGAVIALNLFGAAPGIGVSSFVGEHPDFLATPEALPYLYALQPERNPKREPTTAGNSRVSPLAAEAWKLLEREGALTTMRAALATRSRGHRSRRAALLSPSCGTPCAWCPIPAENPQEGAHWELLSARHRRELNIGSTQSQTTALSILVSFYLQSAVAATAEEVEIFLSPVASRSRIRDVVHGLSTTRQLASFSLTGEGQLYVEGIAARDSEEEETVVLAAGAIAGEDAGLEQNEPDLTEAAAANPAAISQAKASRAPTVSRVPHSESVPAAVSQRAIAEPIASHDRPPRREGGFRRPQRSDSAERGSFRRSEGSSEGAEGTSRPPRPNFERRARPSFAASADRRERPARPGSSDRPKRFERPDRPASGGAFEAASAKAVRHVPVAAASGPKAFQKAVSGQALWRPPAPLRRRWCGAPALPSGSGRKVIAIRPTTIRQGPSRPSAARWRAAAAQLWQWRRRARSDRPLRRPADPAVVKIVPTAPSVSRAGGSSDRRLQPYPASRWRVAPAISRW